MDLHGTFGLALDPPGGPWQSGWLTASTILTWNGAMPPGQEDLIVGIIPNILPGLPPLAEFEVQDLAFHLESPSFALAPDGSFQTDAILYVDGGDLCIVTIVGAGGSVPMDQFGPSDPTPVSGRVVDSGGLAVADLQGDFRVSYQDPTVFVDVALDLSLHAEGLCRSTLTATPLVAGQASTVSLAGARAFAPAWLLWSRTGPGATPVPGLGITLELDQPVLFAQAATDAAGRASWAVPVPPFAAGLDVWLQAAQDGLVSNVLAETVQ